MKCFRGASSEALKPSDTSEGQKPLLPLILLTKVHSFMGALPLHNLFVPQIFICVMRFLRCVAGSHLLAIFHMEGESAAFQLWLAD